MIEKLELEQFCDEEYKKKTPTIKPVERDIRTSSLSSKSPGCTIVSIWSSLRAIDQNAICFHGSFG